jgi:hypothetical protein
MSANPKVRLADNAIERNGGLIWNRLHSEREEICEAMLKEARPNSETQLQGSAARAEARRAANWHRELLQTRLRKIDDALDRLMEGS